MVTYVRNVKVFGVLCIVYMASVFSITAQRRLPIKGLEVYTAVGITYFSGDLGGTNTIINANPKTMNFALGGGLRYYFTNHWAGRIAVSYGRLTADDVSASDEYRKIRNLNFKSDVTDVSLQAEYSLFNWNIKGIKKKLYRSNYNRRHNIFFFTGVSVFKFRPYGELNGQWYSLQELSTEGQGLPGGKNKYKLYSFSIPMGLGYKILLGDKISLGLEVTFRKTFTDYIDDVSGSYYDNNLLRQHKGDLAADIADKNKSKEGVKRAGGALRGNPSSNDNFAFFFITVNRKINLYRSAKRGIPCPSSGLE